MKKAILLLGMVIFVAGVLYLRDVDADTVLIKRDNLKANIEQVTQKKEILPDTGCEETTETIEESSMEAVPENDTAVLAGTDAVSRFAFLCLTAEEQKVYMEILASLLKHETETTLSTHNTGVIDKAFQCVMIDHPEIFFVDGYRYIEYKNNEVIEKVTFSGNYLYDAEEIEKRREQIAEAIEKLINAMPVTNDPYEKVKYAYETIINCTEYDYAAQDHQNICSVFLNGRSVCQGYAKAMQYLLLNMGIEATLVSGTVRDGDGHAWNMVRINEEWYHLDATWGDAYYLFEREPDQTVHSGGNRVNYDYLCVTTEQIEQTHTIEMPIEVPLCDAVTDNYYIRENLYFEEYDEARIAALFESAIKEGMETITIKCGSSVAYENICYELLDNQKIFDMIPIEDVTIAYTDNAQQKCITFWL